MSDEKTKKRNALLAALGGGTLGAGAGYGASTLGGNSDDDAEPIIADDPAGLREKQRQLIQPTSPGEDNKVVLASIKEAMSKLALRSPGAPYDLGNMLIRDPQPQQIDPQLKKRLEEVMRDYSDQPRNPVSPFGPIERPLNPMDPYKHIKEFGKRLPYNPMDSGLICSQKSNDVS
jgi:hypothetical protein